MSHTVDKIHEGLGAVYIGAHPDTYFFLIHISSDSPPRIDQSGFLIPVLDTMVLARAREVVVTDGGAYGAFIKDVLWRRHWVFEIVQRGIIQQHALWGAHRDTLPISPELKVTANNSMFLVIALQETPGAWRYPHRLARSTILSDVLCSEQEELNSSIGNHERKISTRIPSIHHNDD
ncbi:hypothetical protein BD769DRAFT_1646313 [Suillus cothurnatus]|nr:hypothetical protein BD769DRAFT_1646313 [Suillus cothurnatus]